MVSGWGEVKSHFAVLIITTLLRYFFISGDQLKLEEAGGESMLFQVFLNQLKV